MNMRTHIGHPQHRDRFTIAAGCCIANTDSFIHMDEAHLDHAVAVPNWAEGDRLSHDVLDARYEF